MPTYQQRQNNSTPATQAFLKWIEGRHAVPESAGLPDFVPLGAVSAYLRCDGRLTSILTEIFPLPKDRPSSNTILDLYCRVFAILLAIGSAELISVCTDHDELTDAKLPFTVRPKHFPHDTHYGSSGSRRTNNNLFARFQRRQPYFCAPRIERQHKHRLDCDSILPYIEKGKCGEGASSVVYRVKLHSRHDGLQASEGAPHTHVEHRQYALKVYKGTNNRRAWDDEVQAFKALKRTGLEATGLIGHYGSYEYNDEHHLLLELADIGDLEKIAQEERPPSVDSEIVAFWENVLAIVKGMVKIHDIEDGVHQDIKMSNVLVKRRQNTRNLYEAAFGLADLGTMRHRDYITGERTMDNHGVKAYGAPECHRDDTFDDERHFAITAAADIFSLGCLLSELSVWVVFGFEGEHGLQRYREERILGHSDEVRGQDSFHCRGENDRELLPAVIAAHDKLLGASRCDSTTEAIVKMLPELLAIEPEDRPSAKSLRYRLSLLIKKAAAKLSEAYPRSSMQTPPNKRPESSLSSAPSSPSPDRRPARNLVDRPMVVTAAHPGFQSDGRGSHAGYRDSGAMVDSPRNITPQHAPALFRSADIDGLPDANVASLDVEPSQLESPQRRRRARTRSNDTDRTPMPMSYATSGSQRSALDPMRRGTAPVINFTHSRPAHRSSTTAPGSIPSSRSESMDDGYIELGAPAADPRGGMHISALPLRQTTEHIRRSSEQSRSGRQSNYVPADSGLAPSRTPHIPTLHNSTGTEPLTAIPAPAPDQSTPTSYRPETPSPATIPIEQAATHSRASRKPPEFLTYSVAAEYVESAGKNVNPYPAPTLCCS
ncbi:hypothetical protein LTR95_006431 [Oleoguttula sp. CCFEE 5521]